MSSCEKPMLDSLWRSYHQISESPLTHYAKRWSFPLRIASVNMSQLRIWSHLLRKSFMEHFFFCAMIARLTQPFILPRSVNENRVVLMLTNRLIDDEGCVHWLWLVVLRYLRIWVGKSHKSCISQPSLTVQGAHLAFI